LVVVLAFLGVVQPFGAAVAAEFSEGQAIEVSTLGAQGSVVSRLVYLADPEGALDVADVINKPGTAWQFSTADALNLGVTPTPHWFSIRLINASNQTVGKLLE